MYHIETPHILLSVYIFFVYLITTNRRLAAMYQVHRLLQLHFRRGHENFHYYYFELIHTDW